MYFEGNVFVVHTHEYRLEINHASKRLVPISLSSPLQNTLLSILVQCNLLCYIIVNSIAMVHVKIVFHLIVLPMGASKL